MISMEAIRKCFGSCRRFDEAMRRREARMAELSKPPGALQARCEVADVAATAARRFARMRGQGTGARSDGGHEIDKVATKAVNC